MSETPSNRAFQTWPSFSPPNAFRGKSLEKLSYTIAIWHRARQGALHLFGHVHNNWMGSRNAVNVGVDVCGYVPVTIGDIAS